MAKQRIDRKSRRRAQEVKRHAGAQSTARDDGFDSRELEITLGSESELKVAIRNELRALVGVCPEHDECHEVVALALQVAESAIWTAMNAAEYRPDGSPQDPSRSDNRESLAVRATTLSACLDLLQGGPESRGRRQAFVLSAINYGAFQVPPDNPKLAREIVLYAVWKTTAAPFELLTDREAHQHTGVVLEKWRSAGGRGRSRWEPSQEFLSRFGLGAKNAKALKEIADTYGFGYSPPQFQHGSREVMLNEFDLISQRFTGCPCCTPEQFAGLEPRKK